MVFLSNRKHFSPLSLCRWLKDQDGDIWAVRNVVVKIGPSVPLCVEHMLLCCLSTSIHLKDYRPCKSYIETKAALSYVVHGHGLPSLLTLSNDKHVWPISAKKSADPWPGRSCQEKPVNIWSTPSVISSSNWMRVSEGGTVVSANKWFHLSSVLFKAILVHFTAQKVPFLLAFYCRFGLWQYHFYYLTLFYECLTE